MPYNLIPDLIHKNLLSGLERGELEAVTMFMDISGFTPMTEALMQKGKEGAEILSDVINRMYVDIIDRVYERNGRITGFAGDAFTAIFPAEDRVGALAAARAVQNIFTEKGMQQTRFGDFHLKAKVGLSAGAVEWGVLGKGGYNTYYFRGPAIDGCAASEHHCEKGQIVMDRPFYEGLDFAAVLTGQTDDPDFWLLTGTPDVPDPDPLGPPSRNEEGALKFLPERIVSRDGGGEFRTVISVFISFDASVPDERLGEITAELLERAVDYTGYWNNLDFGDKGATLLVLFGAPVSHEDDLDRALSFAVEARERYGDALRMGLTIGPVYAGMIGSERRATYTAMGDVVNLSARLMMYARPQQLLASGALAERARGKFIMEGRGEATLKGKAEPQAVFELTGRARAETNRTSAAQGDLAGRDELLAELVHCMEPLREGRFGGVVYLYGDAGIGKTRLLAEMDGAAADVEFLGLQADAILRKSMNPFVKYFAEFFDQNDVHDPGARKMRFENKFQEMIAGLGELQLPERTDPIVQELHRAKSLLGAMLAIHWEGSLHEQLDAKGRFENTLYVIKEFFKGRSLVRPIVIVLDDFHVIDADSATILETVARKIDDFPLLIAAAGRFQDDGEKRMLELDADIPVYERDLQPLEPGAVHRLVALRLKHEPDADLLEFIASRTGGNPFFIEQFCLYLLDNNLLEQHEGRLTLKGEIGELPVGINNLLISRLDRLNPALKQMVQVAAVLGQEFETEVLRPVLKNSEPENLLEEGVRERIWRTQSGARFFFNNGLLRDAAYDMQLRDRIRGLHQSAGGVMEGLFAADETRAADIAYHYERAEIADKAREYLFKAGQYALDNYKSSKALEFFDRLLKYELSSEEKLQIFRKRGTIMELTGRWDEAVETLEQGVGIAFASRNVYERARLMAQMGALYQKQGRYDDAIDFLTRASQTSGDLGDSENEGNALLDLGRAYWSKGAYEESVKYYKEALKVKEKAGDKLGIALAHYYKGVTDRDMGDYDEAMACYGESLKLLEELDEKRYLTYPVYDIGVLYQYRGDLDQALEYFLRSRDAYEEIGYKSGTSAALLNLGVIEVRQGKFEEALSFYEDSLRIAEETGEQLAIAYTRFSIGAAYYMEGKYDETVRNFEAAFQIMKAIGAKGYYGYIYAYLTCVYARQTQPTKALKTAILHYRIIKELGSDVENGRTAMGVAIALAAAKDGRALGENARQYLDVLSKLAGCEPTPESFFETAVARAREADYINTLVPALREYGQYLRLKHGDSGAGAAKGLELLREARERAAGSGMLRQLSRIQEFTAAHGVSLDD